jgi:XTP/dITP diphosphohydrolase
MGRITKLVLATHNKDKVKEFAEMLSGLRIEVLSLDAFPSVKEVIEDGDTLEANAIKKAREVFAQTGIPSMADDTGLEVFYLNKAPGVYSARYAGEGVTYSQNVRKLLRDLRGVPERRRQAQFRCVLAIVGAEPSPILAEGVCPGTILEAPRGVNGFGYDPIFVPSGFRKTFAELASTEKHEISHRGLAVRKMRDLLK